MEVEILPQSDALSRRYGASDGRLFLVRPDGYIGGKAAARDAGLLEQHLSRQLWNLG